MERDPIAADRIDLPDDLDSDALAGFLETHTEYRLWSDADGEPLLVELGERDEDSDEDEFAGAVDYYQPSPPQPDIEVAGPGLDFPPTPEPFRRRRSRGLSDERFNAEEAVGRWGDDAR